MTLAKGFLSRRETKRNRRLVERAIQNAPSASMREELIIAAQRVNVR